MGSNRLQQHQSGPPTCAPTVHDGAGHAGQSRFWSDRASLHAPPRVMHGPMLIGFECQFQLPDRLPPSCRPVSFPFMLSHFCLSMRLAKTPPTRPCPCPHETHTEREGERLRQASNHTRRRVGNGCLVSGRNLVGIPNACASTAEKPVAATV